ncbi:hypothetical protein FNW02_32885 [Komarekiella sp. 'clone 1']|uniref:Uncharacterized protein n=1 Tax=Komarekiella delphini-convector SJRDD-AB1 TaxID=2593771 RepID=A0AA40T3V7_9NOST|nr:hypothetical protein [Komarekiella delphini-convector]MBD6620451.1 hypothetical protein [Komarekiella delphini-convector SJRDD-AB1]
MSLQTITSELLRELSREEQEILSGGQNGRDRDGDRDRDRDRDKDRDKRYKCRYCYDCERYRD